MKQQKKFSQQEEQHQQTAAQQAAPAPMEFETPEELLRHDAQQTVVPATIEARLAESAADLPPPARSWWRRLFGK
ncbi:MAG TPA: hypothetical protein GYA07_12405 [Verrucomicrobia bacterium]|nr:hypothetical protein [Verrucomicrobiota bacterium]HOB32831.1 hypothetical protein [Verrucomicrobiota bacterium]HOP95973.1 hypothetical protein [Verrucomicrobiota bacterium]HPU55094.1 hypothetical protein [Verrucomicrobiota bacterium]